MLFSHHPVTLRQLQYAVAVAEDLSFRRAAERCGVSQPTLSVQVAEMERALDVQLFERSRRGVLVTRAGRVILERARTVLIATDDLVESARQSSGPLAGTLRLGVIPTLAPYLLPDLDPALRAAFPGLSLQWREDRTARLVADIREGKLDAALLAREAEIGDLETAEVGIDGFVVAASRTHPLGGCESPVSVEALTGERVLLLEEGHCFGDQAADVCAQVGAGDVGFRATSLSTLVQMVIGDDGATVLPRVALERENARGQLAIRPFAGTAPFRTIVFAWRRGSALADALQELSRAARATYESLVELREE